MSYSVRLPVDATFESVGGALTFTGFDVDYDGNPDALVWSERANTWYSVEEVEKWGGNIRATFDAAMLAFAAIENENATKAIAAGLAPEPSKEDDMPKFQKGDVKTPRPTLFDHTVTSEHPVLMTADGAPIPIASSKTVLFNRGLEYANTPESKAAMVTAAYANEVGLTLAWPGTQWTDLFEIRPLTSAQVEWLLRTLGFEPEEKFVVNGKPYRKVR